MGVRDRSWRRVVMGVGLAMTAAIASAGEPNGAQLFDGYCAECHGARGRGDGPDADLFSPRPRDLRGGALDQYSDDDLVERIRHGRPLSLARDVDALHARASDTEMLVGYLRRLPTLAWRRLERGQELYVDRCEACHGPFGRPPAALPVGVRKPPRDLSDPGYQRATSDATLGDRIQRGHRGMPAIPGFEVRENRDAVVAFVRLLSPGYERYSRLCAACHGDDGAGPGAAGGTVKRPTAVFDAAYFAKKDPEVLRRDVWHMLTEEGSAMPHMSHVLGPRDVRAILAYLRSLPAE